MSHSFKMFSLAVLSFCLVLLFGCSTAIDPAVAEKEVRQKTDEMVEAWRLNDQDSFERNTVNEYLINGNVVVSLYKLTWTFDSGRLNEVRVTDVWSRHESQWKLLSQHVSRISLTDPTDSGTAEE